MKIAEIVTLPVGTPLRTRGGDRVTYTHVGHVSYGGNQVRRVFVSSQTGAIAELTPQDVAGVDYSDTIDQRADVSSVGHSITVERLDARTAREFYTAADAGKLAVVERHAGRLGKICIIEPVLSSMEDYAKGTAHTYGAAYVTVRPVLVRDRTFLGIATLRRGHLTVSLVDPVTNVSHRSFGGGSEQMIPDTIGQLAKELAHDRL